MPWLNEPVEHVRDLRAEFLAKLALPERLGSDRASLVVAQRRVLESILARLSEQKQNADDFDKTIVAWRYQVAQAALRFLESLESLDGSNPAAGAMDQSRARRRT